MSFEILVLNDDRPGNNNQCIALAEELSKENNFKYQIVSVKYSFLSKFPNFIFKKSLLRIDENSRNRLNDSIKNNYPKIIISAGRRLAPISVYIKEKSKNYSKIIQIMKPQISSKFFDLIILPQHDLNDKKNKRINDKIIYSIGALNSVNEANLENAKKKFANIFENYQQNKNKIAVILGGKTRNYQISDQTIVSLAEKLNKIFLKKDTIFFILNSRRTEDKITEIFLKNLKCQYVFFDWKKYQGEKNPYQAVLAYSDQIITSCDSISIISECCSSGKATYVFDHLKSPSKKHKKFLDFALRNKLIKKFDFNKNNLKSFIPEKLQETKRISSIIKFKLLKS